MIRFFVFAGSLLIALCSCGYRIVKVSGTEFRPAGPPADWPVRYPASRYLTGIGASPTSWGMWVALQRASDDARAEIARTIESRVESRRELFIRSSLSAGYPDGKNNRILRTESKNLSSFIRVSTDQIVQGVELKEKHHDQNERVLYVLGVIDRVAASERLARQTEELDHRIALLRGQARKREAARDFLAAVQLYRKALGASLQADVLRQQASVLDPHSADHTGATHASAELAVTLGALLSNTELSITGNRLGAIEGEIQQAMAGAGFTVRRQSLSPTGLTLRCSMEEKCYPGSSKYKELRVCRLSLEIEIADMRTRRIAGQVTLLGTSNGHNDASARGGALRNLRREVKEKLPDAFYEALSIKGSE